MQGGLQAELLKSSRPTCVVRGVRCQQLDKDSMAMDILIRQRCISLLVPMLCLTFEKVFRC